MSTHGFVGLPPDGAGKKVPQSVMLEITYDTKTTDFTVGDIVSFSTSTSVNATVLLVNPATATTGELHCRVDEPVPETFNFAVGENIIVNATTYAKLTSVADPLYFQNIVLTGKNMMHAAEITSDGSVQATFAGGSPQFDAFGKLMVSEQTTLGEYVMSYDDLSSEFTTEITGGATSVYDNDMRGVLITCGTASGDKVVRTSDEYHVYQAGYSQLLEFTGSMGDTGKANVIRRGGYYDDENGCYFEFNETVFGVGIRSNVTGSVVDTFIPQAEWNHDRLDGSDSEFNPSGKTANPTNNNLFWIDLQWLGAGVVRFGVVIDGVRIVAHQTQPASSKPYMTTGSLPFRYEQENIGVAGSSSELRIFSGIVKTEGKIQSRKSPYTTTASASITTTTDTALLAVRPSQTYKTFNNRSTTYPVSFEIHNTATEPVRINLHRGSTATAGSWASAGSSATDVNTTMSGWTGGENRVTFLIGGGETRTIPFPTIAEARRGLRRKADITQVVEMMASAQLLAAGTGGTVYLTFNWDEIRD